METTMKEEMGDEALQLVARRFAVLGEPMRLRLLQDLTEGERSVNELAARSGGTQANVSRHLQTLAGEGLIKHAAARARRCFTPLRIPRCSTCAPSCAAAYAKRYAARMTQ
jgi:DNA-binding transcriptional ArsR family regulator